MAASKALATTSVQSFGMGVVSDCVRETSAAARRYAGSSTRKRSIGCPHSSQSAVSDCSAGASAVIAPRPASCDAAGNAQALPSVIEPKPEASRPSPVRTRQVTFRIVTRSTVRPPNWYGAR
jgi:hypothetical protein